MLLARFDVALLLSCTTCCCQERIIAFMNNAGTVNKFLEHIGEST